MRLHVELDIIIFFWIHFRFKQLISTGIPTMQDTIFIICASISIAERRFCIMSPRSEDGNKPTFRCRINLNINPFYTPLAFARKVAIQRNSHLIIALAIRLCYPTINDISRTGHICFPGPGRFIVLALWMVSRINRRPFYFD